MKITNISRNQYNEIVVDYFEDKIEHRVIFNTQWEFDKWIKDEKYKRDMKLAFYSLLIFFIGVFVFVGYVVITIALNTKY
jgi:hypothetical protein